MKARPLRVGDRLKAAPPHPNFKSCDHDAWTNTVLAFDDRGITFNALDGCLSGSDPAPFKHYVHEDGTPIEPPADTARALELRVGDVVRCGCDDEEQRIVREEGGCFWTDKDDVATRGTLPGHFMFLRREPDAEVAKVETVPAQQLATAKAMYRDLQTHANRLADACGDLRAERDELAVENSMLRRKVERLERRR